MTHSSRSKGRSRSKTTSIIAAAAAAATVLLSPAASARTLPPALESAAALRRLDMMLMVTSLRCRTGESDFRSEYDAFRVRYMPQLRKAALAVTAEFTRSMGARGATDAFDKMSVAMANYYGAGHPRFGCAELKREVGALARQSGDAALGAAADRLLDDEGATRTLIARL